ncbi:MAG: hypothetical protein ABSB10_00440 [Candidatus Bathyarchaeia archaeon]|jgi:hypothetical protein
MVELDAKFCPICGCKLHVDGKRLLCDRHGEMNVYLDHDPKVAEGAFDERVSDLEAKT